MPRCAECRRKVGLLGLTCRCGALFCAAHAPAEAHACDFDYRSAGRAILAKKAGLVGTGS